MPRSGEERHVPRLLYLPVDRKRASVTLLGEPDQDDCQQVIAMPFGKEIELPAPFSMTLVTTDFA